MRRQNARKRWTRKREASGGKRHQPHPPSTHRGGMGWTGPGPALSPARTRTGQRHRGAPTQSAGPTMRLTRRPMPTAAKRHIALARQEAPGPHAVSRTEADEGEGRRGARVGRTRRPPAQVSNRPSPPPGGAEEGEAGWGGPAAHPHSSKKEPCRRRTTHPLPHAEAVRRVALHTGAERANLRREKQQQRRRYATASRWPPIQQRGGKERERDRETEREKERRRERDTKRLGLRDSERDEGKDVRSQQNLMNFDGH